MTEKVSTHINEKENYHMVDIGHKEVTEREARAQARVFLGEELYSRLKKDSHTKKGDVFSVAIIAGIMAAKNCSQLIPLCHPIPLSKVEVDYHFDEGSTIIFEATVKTSGKTGVEMEAMMAANIAAITLYDMCKSIWKGIVIEEVKLLEKRGGKSGDYHAQS